MPYFYLSLCHMRKIIQHTVFLFNFTLCTRKKTRTFHQWSQKIHLDLNLSLFPVFRLNTILITNLETGAICLEFSPDFLHSLLTPSFSLTFAPLLPQCWARRILKQWDDCNTQINIGEGENHTSVSRFVTSIVGWFAIWFVSKPWLFMN